MAAGKRTRGLTTRQRRLVKGLVEGKSGAQAAREAGYAESTAHAGLAEMLQRSKTLRDAVAEAMDRKGLTDDKIFDRLQQSLDATEVKVFNHEGTVIYSKPLVAHDIRLRAVETCGRFRGYIGGKSDLKLEDRRSVIVDMSGQLSQAVLDGADTEELVLRFGGRER